MDLSTNLKPGEEAPPPAASGIYYNEAPTEEKHFIQTESTNTSHQQPPDISSIAPAGCVPMVQVFETEPYTEAHWYPLDIVCRTFREQGNNIIYLYLSSLNCYDAVGKQTFLINISFTI